MLPADQRRTPCHHSISITKAQHPTDPYVRTSSTFSNGIKGALLTAFLNLEWILFSVEVAAGVSDAVFRGPYSSIRLNHASGLPPVDSAGWHRPVLLNHGILLQVRSK